MSKITTAVFDVGNVLFQWNLRLLFEKLIADPEELDWFMAHVMTMEWHLEHDAGKPLAQMRAERVKLFPEHAALIDAYFTRFNETIPGPVPGSHAIVEALAARDVPLFAITNFGTEFWDGFYPEEPIFRHFSDIIVSGREKMIKPDPAIFQLALNRFGLAPGEAIFIDDNLANVDAARANGFVAHHFQDADGLRAELAHLGVLND
jgi:2-haloacid dehalogenase